MSLGYSDNGLWHAPLDEGVVDQLSRRSEIVGKRTSRTSQDLTYLNSNTGWVKVTSAVDFKDLGDGETQPAEDFILYGGIYSNRFGRRQGFSQNLQGGFNENSSYTLSETQGIVPMPGITSFNVQSKDYYGSIRGASFNFTVHSIEDFDKLESLFLRPGFSILIEWGHSIKVDNEDGSIDTIVEEYPSSEFLTKKDYFELLGELAKYRGPEKNSYNYDALYGWISNFAWSYNGYSYECQVDILSAGSLLIALQTGNLSLSRTDKNEKYNPVNYSNELERVLSVIKDAPSFTGTFNTEETTVKAQTLTDQLKQTISEECNQYSDLFKDSSFIFSYLAGKAEKGVGTYKGSKYLTLRDLFKLINKIGLLKDSNNRNIISIETESVIPFTTFPEHIALDPHSFILPKKSQSEYTLKLSTQVTNLDPSDCLNIFVNIDYILFLLFKIGKKESKFRTLHTLLTQIINELNSNLGGINSFDLTFIEETSKFLLVDRSVIPDSKDFKLGANNKPKSYIDLVGLESEVTNVNIVSKLDSDFVNLLAMAAQSGPQSDASSYILNAQEWSAGLIDRHFPVKTIGTSENTTGAFDREDEEATPNSVVVEEYLKFIRDVNNTKNNFYIGFEEDYFIGKQTTHQLATIQLFRKNTVREKVNFAGVLPFQLNFTIKGISGLKVGNTFRINDFFLPERYKGKVAFVIKGIDNKVENNIWTTDISAFMYPLFYGVT